MNFPKNRELILKNKKIKIDFDLLQNLKHAQHIASFKKGTAGEF